MKDFIRAFGQSNRFFGPVLKRSWGWLLVTTFGCELFHQYFSYMNVHYRPASGVNLTAALGEILVSLVEFFVFTLLIPQRVMELQRNEPAKSFGDFAAVHVKPLAAESLRALAVTILWTLALILPGVVKYLRFFLVPYVVVADPAYQSGEVDALEESNRLVKGVTLQLFVLVGVLAALDGWQSAVRERFPVTGFPLVAIAATAGFFVVNYYANVFLFMLYQARKDRLGGKS